MPSVIYAHLTWTTRERATLIDADRADFLGRALPNIAARYGAQCLTFGAVTDHLHILLDLPSVYDVPRLVQGLKGATARIVNRDRIGKGPPLRWAAGYDLRSVSPDGRLDVERYIENQARHHPHLAIHETRPAK